MKIHKILTIAITLFIFNSELVAHPENYTCEQKLMGNIICDLSILPREDKLRFLVEILDVSQKDAKRLLKQTILADSTKDLAKEFLSEKLDYQFHRVTIILLYLWIIENGHLDIAKELIDKIDITTIPADTVKGSVHLLIFAQEDPKFDIKVNHSIKLPIINMIAKAYVDAKLQLPFDKELLAWAIKHKYDNLIKFLKDADISEQPVTKSIDNWDCTEDCN